MTLNVQTTLYSSLTTSTEKYSRYGASGSNYHYEVYRIIVPRTGSYIFRSNSSIDTYGYFYSSVFHPDQSYWNLIADDDNSAGDGQFQIQMYLRGDFAYELVVTTASQDATGSYSITVLGLNPVNIERVTRSSTEMSNFGISISFATQKQFRVLFLVFISHEVRSCLILLTITYLIQCTDL